VSSWFLDGAVAFVVVVVVVVRVEDGLVVVNMVDLGLAGDDVGVVARAATQEEDEAGDQGYQAAAADDGAHDDADDHTYAQHVHVLPE
jgi:hypothetical protein